MKDNSKFASQTYVAVAPEGMDPLDLRIKKGPGAVKELIENAVPLVEFVIEQKLEEYQLGSSEGKVNAMRAVLPILKDIQDPLLQQEYIRRSAGLIGLPENDVRSAFAAFVKNSNAYEKPDFARNEPEEKEVSYEVELPSPTDIKLRDERELIKALYQSGENHSVDLYAGAFKADFYGKLFELYNTKPAEVRASEFIETLYRGKPEETFIASILMEPVKVEKSSNLDEHLESLSLNILYADSERKVQEKRLELASCTDPEKTVELVTQIMALENFKRSLRNK
jgi:DNA primase